MTESTKLRWTATGEHGWVSTSGMYRLEENEATGNVFIYRVTHSANARTGNGHWDALLNARYNLPDAKRFAQEHHDAEVAKRQA